jgi:hypothetical protein
LDKWLLFSLVPHDGYGQETRTENRFGETDQESVGENRGDRVGEGESDNKLASGKGNVCRRVWYNLEINTYGSPDHH